MWRSRCQKSSLFCKMQSLSYLKTLCPGTYNTHTHTRNLPAFPRFPWKPVAKEQRIQGQVFLQMRVPRITCVHRAAVTGPSHPPAHTLVLWCYLHVRLLRSLVHLQNMLCFRVSSVSVCAPHVQEQNKHRHTLIWSQIDQTVPTSLSPQSMNNCL